jgi:hypothetical protein
MDLAVWRPRIGTNAMPAGPPSEPIETRTTHAISFFARSHWRMPIRCDGAVTWWWHTTSALSFETVCSLSRQLYQMLNVVDPHVTLSRASRGVDGILSMTRDPHSPPRVSQLGYSSGRWTRNAAQQVHEPHSTGDAVRCAICRTLPFASAPVVSLRIWPCSEGLARTKGDASNGGCHVQPSTHTVLRTANTLPEVRIARRKRLFLIPSLVD